MTAVAGGDDGGARRQTGWLQDLPLHDSRGGLRTRPVSSPADGDNNGAPLDPQGAARRRRRRRCVCVWAGSLRVVRALWLADPPELPHRHRYSGRMECGPLSRVLQLPRPAGGACGGPRHHLTRGAELRPNRPCTGHGLGVLRPHGHHRVSVSTLLGPSCTTRGVRFASGFITQRSAWGWPAQTLYVNW